MYAPPPLPEHQLTVSDLPKVPAGEIPPALLAVLATEAPAQAPVDIVKDNLPKLTPAQRKVIRQLLDAYDSLDQVR